MIFNPSIPRPVVGLLAGLLVFSACSSDTGPEDAADRSVSETAISAGSESGSETSVDGGLEPSEVPVSDSAAAEAGEADANLESESVSATPEQTYDQEAGLACANVEFALLQVLGDPDSATTLSDLATEAITRAKASGDERFTAAIAGLDGDPTTTDWQRSARSFLDACEAAGYEVL